MMRGVSQRSQSDTIDNFAPWRKLLKSQTMPEARKESNGVFTSHTVLCKSSKDDF